MTRTEYKVVPAPEKARKVRGLKGPALFAHAVEGLMNDLAQDGWTYVRTDTLPQEERSGLTNKVTTYRNLLVFQRVVSEGEPESAPNPAPVSAPVAARPTIADEADDEVTNLWQTTDDEHDETRGDKSGEKNRGLIADR
ncbi:MAG: DUF4177 domain-containing protein [Roseicyclus sp.]|nr:DUF4177 domain-containing protein [Roseicyclus sp.]